MGIFSIRKMPFMIGGIIITVSVTVMIGWLLEIPAFLSIIPNAPTMKFNTALLFFLMGTTFFIPKISNKNANNVNTSISFLTCILALTSIISNFTAIDLDVEHLFIKDNFSSIQTGKMSIATAFCFLLVGVSKIYQTKGKYFIKVKGSILLNIVALAALSTAIAYMIGIPAHERFGIFDSMAIHTAILFILLSYGISLCEPNIGFVKTLHNNLLGSKLLQKALPFITLLPLGIGMGFIYLEKNGIATTAFGVVLGVTTFVAIGIVYISVIAKQINDADLISQQLQYSLQKINNDLNYFKTALDASTIVAITDRRGVITYVNDKFCEISKYPRAELIGKTHALINSGYHEKDFFKNLWKTIGTGKIWKGEIKNRAKDGSYYWVLTSIVPFVNEQGKIYQYLAIRQDITEKKESEELFASHYVKELERKNKELEQFTYIASHDLQEPLRTIQNFVEIIEEDYSSTAAGDDIKTHLNYINSASTRMSNLIKGLLDYSLIGRKTILEEIDTEELIENVVKDLHMTIKETNTRISFNQLPSIMGYKSELGALFQNLISNGIKFCAPDKLPLIEIGAEDKRHFVDFYVKDNGIGIEPKYMDKIFIIFQRLQNRKEAKGTGIGLAHCKKIVELHGGKIWVESDPGQGTTFHFTLSKHLEDLS